MARRRKKKSLHITGETTEEKAKRLEIERIAEKVQARAHGVLIAMKSKVPNLDFPRSKSKPTPIGVNLSLSRELNRIKQQEQKS